MTPAGLLTRLYPPAVREQWGDELTREISASGVRCWPDTVAGAVRLWLHPSDWPGSRTERARHDLTVALAGVVASTALLLRSVAPSATMTADIRHPVTSLWLAPLLLGVLLAAPLPPLRSASLVRLARTAVRTLAAPAAVGAALVVTAWSGVARNVTGYPDAALVLAYWLTLGFAALRMCTLVARAGGATTPPTPRRLRAAFLLTGTGLAFGAGQRLLPAATTGLHPGALAQGLALALLAATTVSAGHDLRRGPA
ncbi:hypothetical protein [Actinacidiphila acidipaludis]|uniref:Uncharacterized protein n=1 Tax=Actinacidiphila acidipaludis TaxID=2873382 RepID=A0ABS7QI90_9ACTN|nr:hypothetical protein [Streptomyces acidipaludis]MBY8882135.1 hypothetical protein [Streptomyces acidipaludis]